jgi:hypothetical protein
MMTAIKIWNPAAGECHCNFDAGYLFDEIAAGRPAQEYQQREYRDHEGKMQREYVLICRTCSGSWNHTATDWLIDRVINPVSFFYETMAISEDLPIHEPWEMTVYDRQTHHTARQ